MELLFSLTPAVSEERREDIIGMLEAALPESHAKLSKDGSRLLLALAEQTDPVTAADATELRLLSQGIRAVQLTRAATPPPYVPINMNMGMTTEKPKKRVRVRTLVLSLVATLLLSSILTYAITFFVFSLNPHIIYADYNLGNEEGKGEDFAEKITLVDTIFDQFSIYDLDGNLLLDAMLKAYAEATGDLYAEYYTAEELEMLLAENNGEMVGIGITIVENTEPRGAVIIDVLPDSPALAGGLMPGDVIVSATSNGKTVSAAESGVDPMLAVMRGEAGTEVTLTVTRNGSSFSVTLVREKLTSHSVSGKVSETNAKVGILRISSFDLTTPKQFKAEMDRLLAAGCEKFVFDVRNNPGGDLKSVVGVLSLFLEEGDALLSITDKNKNVEYYKVEEASYDGDYADCSVTAEDIGKYRGYSFAVLTNGNTASAAELFTATLRDYELATVVGETTFGKGILQSIIPLEPFGFEGAVKLTTGYYSPPSGVNYDGEGITPDKAVSLTGAAAEKNLYLLTESEDTQLQAAIAALLQ